MHRPEQTPIPDPDVVREHLARNLRENRLLRSQLRVSERAAEQRHAETCRPRHEPARQAVAP